MPSSNNFGSPVSHSSSCRMQHFFFFIFNNVILWLNFLFFFFILSARWFLDCVRHGVLWRVHGCHTLNVFYLNLRRFFFVHCYYARRKKKRMTSSRKWRLGDAFDICQLNLCVFLFCSRAYRPWCSVWTNGYCRFRYLRLTTNLHILRLRFDLLTSTL